jgi:protein-L-isoaspartate(D-aspartate) O-methyltransferase
MGSSAAWQRIVVMGLCVCAACTKRVGTVNDHDESGTEQRRMEMVDQLRAYGIRDARILKAMAKIPRHRFIPEAERSLRDSYADSPAPIGHGQTISQPYIVAYMTERLQLRPGEKVLEIGTGSGYQAAVLAEMGTEVYSIEIVPALADHARRTLAQEGYSAVRVRTGDGYLGWPEHAPFDAIIGTCAPDAVPPALVEQLREGGRMILPVGGGFQRLLLLRKRNGTVRTEEDLPVRFVPMVRAERERP